MRIRREVAERQASISGRNDIPRAAHRTNERHLAGTVDLSTETADMDVDHVGTRIEMKTPHVFEDHLSRHHLAGVAHQELEEAELGRQEGQRLTVAQGVMTNQVELQVGNPQPVAVRVGLSAAQEDFRARGQLVGCERLGQVIVATGTQSANAFIHVGKRADHQHGRVDRALAQGEHHVDPIHAREHAVEGDDVEAILERAGEAVASVGHPLGREAVRAQLRDDVACGDFIIFDDQCPGHPLHSIGGQRKTAPPGGRSGSYAQRGTQAAMATRIFFMAFASIWRMRSAETPYSSARSCSVALLSSASQRRWMMSRERASRLPSADDSAPIWFLLASSSARLSYGSAPSSTRNAAGAGLSSSSASAGASKPTSRPDRRDSISRTVASGTPRSWATTRTSSAFIQPRRFLLLRRLKNSLRWALVVATFTMRQLRRMNSCISARIQCTAKLTRRTPWSGSKRFTAFIRPMLPSWMRSESCRP